MGRFVVFTGPPTVSAGGVTGFNAFPTTTPTAGGIVDGCSGGEADSGGWWGPRYGAGPGEPIVVESGGSFSAGDDLETDGQGRAVQHSSGEIVARALEGASGSGEQVWAVFQ